MLPWCINFQSLTIFEIVMQHISFLRDLVDNVEVEIAKGFVILNGGTPSFLHGLSG